MDFAAEFAAVAGALRVDRRIYGSDARRADFCNALAAPLQSAVVSADVRRYSGCLFADVHGRWR